MAKPDTSFSRPSSSAVVASVAVVTLACLALYCTWRFTASRIEHNEHAWLAAQINMLVPAASHDNDLLDDRITLDAPEYLGDNNSATVYRLRRNGLPAGAVIHCLAPDGYGGPIELLVAVTYDGEVSGVNILAHHETPGIGNAFEFPGSHWLDSFRGRSLHNPDTAGWNVRKDGGMFEQFTSATITPRAIIKGVQHVLDFYQHYRERIFTTASMQP
ncbi:MAG TPA: RnfABCDGE type electron transport complex subunit G [Steroidobacteraceae bacterium]|nr:RnfABCDGE type electron transport complex subunit G [Steroidobacteraceae bacterium]